MRKLIILFLLVGCAKPSIKPNPYGEYRLPITLKREGLLVCKVFEQEANCYEVDTGNKYVIPIDVWDSDFSHKFHSYLDSDVKALLDQVNYVCDNGIECTDKDKKDLENIGKFIYKEDK